MANYDTIRIHCPRVKEKQLDLTDLQLKQETSVIYEHRRCQ